MNSDNERFSSKWLPMILQTIGFLASAFLYANQQEHRLTVIEEGLRSQYQIIIQEQDSRKLLVEQMMETEKSISRLVALEEYIHHQNDTRSQRR